MCITKFKIKRSYPKIFFGKDYVFAPCGKCEDCRKHSQYSWAWRLSSDIQYYVKERGYRCGFITLTYDDAHIPRFPEYLDDKFSTLNPVAGEMCFSRKDTEDLILYLRKVMNRDRGIKELLYFLGSEYGPSTQRPHYHMIIAWPSSSQKLKKVRGKDEYVVIGEYDNTAEYVHGLIKHYWTEYKCNGFVSPNHYMGGGSKRSGKKYLPFEVGSLSDCLNSAFYTAKYVTKDLYYCSDLMERLLNFYRADFDTHDYDIDEKVRSVIAHLKDYMPHHRQTKSLGFRSVASLSDADKIDLLNKGRLFLGSDKLSLPPMYIKNKLMFKPCYFVAPDGKRLVKQECTEFFKRNFTEIMDKKEQYFTALFDSWKDENYWFTSGLSFEDSADAAWFVRMNDAREKFGCSLAEAYIYYYGIPYKMAFKSKELTYKNRYLFNALYPTSFEKISYLHWSNIQKFFGYLMQYVGWQNESVPDADVDYLRDYMNQPLLESA